MSDQFLTPIVSELTDLGYTNVVIQGDPQKREWHELPMVVVAPDRHLSNWHAFNHINMTNIYELYYVDSTDGINVVNTSANDFIVNMVNRFHGNAAALEGAGSWNCIVEPAYDVDRTVFDHQYFVSVVRLYVNWILNP